MNAEERKAKIAELEEKQWVRLPKSKWFRLLDQIKAPCERAPADPVSDATVRWVPIWVKAICEYGGTWAGISQLIPYVMAQDEDFQLALTAQCAAHPESVVEYIRDIVALADDEHEWIGEGLEDDDGE